MSVGFCPLDKDNLTPTHFNVDRYLLRGDKGAMCVVEKPLHIEKSIFDIAGGIYYNILAWVKRDIGASVVYAVHLVD